MYGIFTYIYHKMQPIATKLQVCMYTIHGFYGFGIDRCWNIIGYCQIGPILFPILEMEELDLKWKSWIEMEELDLNIHQTKN